MIVLGLTGSIGMGKSTTAGLFAEAGCPVWDADAAVHRLYSRGGAAVAPVAAVFRGVEVEGAIDRTRLAEALAAEPDGFARLERIVHPLVAADRASALAAALSSGATVAVADIPLLFETGAERQVDGVVVVTAPPEVQAERVLARPDMTPERFAALLARQTPDAEKRRRADFVIDSSLGIEAARAAVADILATVTHPGWISRHRGVSGPTEAGH